MPNYFKAYDPQFIRAELAEENRHQLRRLDIFDVIDSTNVALKNLAASERHGCAFLAETQTMGRGRRGRQWHSPAGQNIYLSLGWNFQESAAKLAHLPLVVAVLVARSVHRIGINRPGIKWPNDIQVEGKKLAGCLVDTLIVGTQSTSSVIGIGLNVHMPEADNDAAIDQAWTDVSSHLPVAVDMQFRDRLCGVLLDELLHGLRKFEANGFDSFRADWNRWDVLMGRKVSVHGSDEVLTGMADGIGKKGGILLRRQTETGETLFEELFAGDVSVRATAGKGE